MRCALIGRNSSTDTDTEGKIMHEKSHLIFSFNLVLKEVCCLLMNMYINDLLNVISSSRQQLKPIDNIPYSYISIHRPIIGKQYSNWIATRECHIVCLIQQHNIIQYKQKDVCTLIICSAKKKLLNCWYGIFSSKQDKI